MCAEIGLTLKESGLGISTCVAMGGDQVTGLTMSDYVELFQQDDETDAIILFGEPGTSNEQGLVELLQARRVDKPIIALIAGSFQERYPPGVSFGHAAAIIGTERDTATAKRIALAEAGVTVVKSLEEISGALKSLDRHHS